jgi:transketolase
MIDLALAPAGTIRRVAEGPDRRDERLGLAADLCRLNALAAVKRAGSGHLGSSFSSLDLMAHLLFETLDTRERGFTDPDRDVFFSSKGHDVPGLYAVLHALGAIPSEKLMLLRRYGGLDGHPDVGTPGIEANSGSLGMGLSKGRGIAWAKRRLGREGLVVVLTGDGELQEGQNWEALQAAAHQGIGRLWAIVDRNELQSDKPTEEILALGDVEAKLRAFGWHVERRSGHDHAALREAFAAFRSLPDDLPKALVADTVKGKGVSFMEHPAALREGRGTYRWHAGAPDDDAYTGARDELLARVAEGLASLGLPPLELESAVAATGTAGSLQGEPESGAGSAARMRDEAEYVAAAFGDELLALAREHEHLVVLDADLASDCRVRAIEDGIPERFVENGIAEQDMVSMAAGMARHGLLPVVSSFASFLASRANEQIYNQASEGTKVVYALHYAGLIPAGPGKSHQSVRDASLLAALPNVAVVHPGSAVETRALLRWAVEDAAESVALRLAIGPSPRTFDLGGAGVRPGVGTVLREGADVVLFAYGPVMLHEALVAADRLAGRGVEAQVVAQPWLNRVDRAWLDPFLEPFDDVVVIEDHAPVGALGSTLAHVLSGSTAARRPRLTVLGVEGWPACGAPGEALRHHGLDGASVADRVGELVRRPATR